MQIPQSTFIFLFMFARLLLCVVSLLTRKCLYLTSPFVEAAFGSTWFASVWIFSNKKGRAFLSDRLSSNTKLGLGLHKSFDRCRKGGISVFHHFFWIRVLKLHYTSIRVTIFLWMLKKYWQSN